MTTEAELKKKLDEALVNTAFVSLRMDSGYFYPTEHESIDRILNALLPIITAHYQLERERHEQALDLVENQLRLTGKQLAECGRKLEALSNASAGEK